MSYSFRDLEFLGKSNGKKWKCHKKFFLRFFFFFICSLQLNILFATTSQSPMSKLFIYYELLGKTNGKKWSRILKLLLIKGVKSPRTKSLIFDEFFLTLFIMPNQTYFISGECLLTMCAGLWARAQAFHHNRKKKKIS